MGEYAKYGGQEIKIGTCETMYYLRADQRMMVRCMSGNVDPVRQATEIRFRFPWPDEDHIQPGAFQDYNRAIAVPGAMVPEGVEHYRVQFSASAGYLVSLPCPETHGTTPGLETTLPNGVKVARNGFSGAVKLTQQKILADGRIVPVCMCGGCGALWRMEGEDEIRALADAFIAEGERRRNDSWREDGRKIGHEFWHKIAERILTGAKLAVAVPV
jgi:hypothetical protein